MSIKHLFVISENKFMKMRFLNILLMALFGINSFLIFADETTNVQNINRNLNEVQNIKQVPPCDTCNIEPVLSHEKSSQLTDYIGEPIELSVLTLDEANKITSEFVNNKNLPFDYALEGCYARAHKMAFMMDEKGIISGKAFVMGRLFASTKYGNAKWGYHVAPVVLVKLNEEIKPYIIDPGLYDHAVPYDEWRDLITGQRPNSPKVVRNMHPEFYTKRFNYDPPHAKDRMTEFNKADLLDTELALNKMLEAKKFLDENMK